MDAERPDPPAHPDAGLAAFSSAREAEVWGALAA